MSSVTIGFSGKSIRIISLRENKEINLLTEVETFQNFSFDISKYSGNNTVISEVADKISGTLKEKEITVNKVSCSLDTNLFHICTIPFEEDTENRGTESTISWELSNYFPNSYNEFTVNYKGLITAGLPAGVSNLLVFGLHEKIYEFFRRVFETCELDIKMIDIDHFATEKVFSEIEKNNFTNKKVFVIGCKKNRVDLSLYNCGELVDYYHFFFRDGTFEREVSKELRLLTKKAVVSEVNSFLIYGEDYAEYIKKELSGRLPGKRIEIVNPLTSKNESFSGEKKYNGLLKYGYRFVPVLGTALKAAAKE